MPITSSQSHRTYIDKIAMRTNCAKLHGQTGEDKTMSRMAKLKQSQSRRSQSKRRKFQNVILLCSLQKKLHYIELVFSYKFILTTYGYTLYGEL